MRDPDLSMEKEMDFPMVMLASPTYLSWITQSNLCWNRGLMEIGGTTTKTITRCNLAVVPIL